MSERPIAPESTRAESPRSRKVLNEVQAPRRPGAALLRHRGLPAGGLLRQLRGDHRRHRATVRRLRRRATSRVREASGERLPADCPPAPAEEQRQPNRVQPGRPERQLDPGDRGALARRVVLRRSGGPAAGGRRQRGSVADSHGDAPQAAKMLAGALAPAPDRLRVHVWHPKGLAERRLRAMTKDGWPGRYTCSPGAARRTSTTRNGQSILANRSQAEAIASCSASSCRCRGTGVGARSFQYGAEARSASVQQ